MKPYQAGWAGILSALLLIPISLLLGATGYPFAGATSARVFEYFGEHRQVFMSAIILEAVSIGLLLVFVAGYAEKASARSSVTGNLLLIAGLATACMIAIEDAAFFGVAFLPNINVVSVLWQLGHFGLGVLVHLFSAVWLLSAFAFAVDATKRSRVLAGVAGVGNAAIIPGLFTTNVSYVAGTTEHLIATLPYAIWLVSAGADLVRKRADAVRNPSNNRPESRRR